MQLITYELQAAGLGIDFLDKIDSAVQDISKNPDRWPSSAFISVAALYIVFLSVFYIALILMKLLS